MIPQLPDAIQSPLDPTTSGRVLMSDGTQFVPSTPIAGGGFEWVGTWEGTPPTKPVYLSHSVGVWS